LGSNDRLDEAANRTQTGGTQQDELMRHEKALDPSHAPC
jgi:hypothetical protein